MDMTTGLNTSSSFKLFIISERDYERAQKLNALTSSGSLNYNIVNENFFAQYFSDFVNSVSTSSSIKCKVTEAKPVATEEVKSKD